MKIKQINPVKFLIEDKGQQILIEQNKQGNYIVGDYQVITTHRGFDIFEFITNEHIYEQSFPEQVLPKKPYAELRSYDNNSRQVYVMNRQVPITMQVSKQLLPEFTNENQSLTKPTEDLIGGVNLFYEVPNYYDLEMNQMRIDWNNII